MIAVEKNEKLYGTKIAILFHLLNDKGMSIFKFDEALNQKTFNSGIKNV